MPRTLATRLVVVAALLLLVAQAISFTLLIRESRQQMVTISAAPAALRIIDTLEGPNERRGPIAPRERVRILLDQPRPPGEANTAIAARATEMLENAGLTPRRVIATIDNQSTLLGPTRMSRIMADKDDKGRERTRSRLHLAVQTPDGKWLLTTSRVREGGPPSLAC